MNVLKFIYIGIIKEYIYYFCFDIKVQDEFGLVKDCFNIFIEIKLSVKKLKFLDIGLGCIMYFCIFIECFVFLNIVLEYCYFELLF